MYPENDKEFEEATIASVEASGDGWSITRNDGWSFFVPVNSPVEPAPGMTARFYGHGIGATVRRLYLDGQCVFYRTGAEDREFRDVEMYGADAAEWVRRWDDGRSIWSIEMGGLGPGYEQCIQMCAVEFVRALLAGKYEPGLFSDPAEWAKIRSEVESTVGNVDAITKLGMSGAQWGAALNLAANIYRHGPRGVMADDRVSDRKIQVSRYFPGAV